MLTWLTNLAKYVFTNLFNLLIAENIASEFADCTHRQPHWSDCWKRRAYYGSFVWLGKSTDTLSMVRLCWFCWWQRLHSSPIGWPAYGMLFLVLRLNKFNLILTTCFLECTASVNMRFFLFFSSCDKSPSKECSENPANDFIHNPMGCHQWNHQNPYGKRTIQDSRYFPVAFPVIS